MKILALPLSALCALGCSTQVVLVPNKSAVMSADRYRSELSRLCSRPVPPTYQGTWTPSAETIADMESRFGTLQHMRASGCCTIGARVGDVNAYIRQYFGIVVDGKQLVYINATAEAGPRTSPPAGSVSDYCDGGTSWGVLFDPTLKRFFDLAFNGN
jgi:hypothetical protein